MNSSTVVRTRTTRRRKRLLTRNGQIVVSVVIGLLLAISVSSIMTLWSLLFNEIFYVKYETLQMVSLFVNYPTATAAILSAVAIVSTSTTIKLINICDSNDRRKERKARRR